MESRKLICVPGQRLCLASDTHVSGQGTYERNGYIYAMLAGFVKIIEKASTKIVEVYSCNEPILIPTQGDIVTAQITVITPDYSRCIIKCIGENVLSKTYRAMIRKEDITATKKDEVEVYNCFGPGDIILARVLPVTEANTYYLSTAENELGVVISHSEAGYVLVPSSWTEMHCPFSLVKYPKKVAKVVPESCSSAETD